MNLKGGGATETPPTTTGTNEPEAGPTEIPTMAAKTNVSLPEGGAIETQIQNLDATLVRQQILQLSPLPKAPHRARKRQAQAASELTLPPPLTKDPWRMHRLAREGWVEEFGLEEVQREGGVCKR